MIDKNSPVTEEELHAYIDGELAPERQEAVADWLASHADAAAQVTAWRAQADAIRARFGAAAAEPVPARLKLERLLREQRRPWGAFTAAAAVSAFIIGGIAGWMAHGASVATPNQFDTFTKEALDAYRLYVVEVRHPVEVPGGERAHMTAWLTKRLGYEQRIPDLQALGLKLVGGRLLPGPTGAAAFYMYEGPSGERFTIYCGRANSAASTALRYRNEDRYAAFYWVDDKVAYVVSGPGNREQMEKITKAVYDQTERPRDGKS